MNLMNVGQGKVSLIAGGGKIYTDIAARFVKSERSMEEIISSEYDSNIVNNIVNSGHKAALEFDYFLFGIEGFARVTETQLVRKRHASYLIKTGRANKQGRRSFDVVMPKEVMEFQTSLDIPASQVLFLDGETISSLEGKLGVKTPRIVYDANNLLEMIEQWYNCGSNVLNLPEEELRYLKPQGTEFKAIIGMNAHALLDWFQIRCCMNAQTEIRDLANKMKALCKEVAPDLFINAGPSCLNLGYCPENQYQHSNCKGKVLTKDFALSVLKNYEATTEINVL